MKRKCPDFCKLQPEMGPPLFWAFNDSKIRVGIFI